MIQTAVIQHLYICTCSYMYEKVTFVAYMCIVYCYIELEVLRLENEYKCKCV